MPPDQYFLITYHLADRSVEVTNFGDDFRGAADAYTSREEDLRGSRDSEVVLVGADSIETIHRTHSHYFLSEESSNLFQSFLDDKRMLSL